METRVSIVVEPCLRFIQAALWKVHPDQNTTGVARTTTSHSQPSNCSGGTIDTSTTGTASTAATMKRRNRSVARRSSESSGLSVSTTP